MSPPDRLEVALQARRGSFALDASLSLAPGAAALVGPSGGGKSTLLEAIAGLTPVDRGHVRVGGQPWLDTSARILVPPERRSVSFVFQRPALFPHLRVGDNVAYGLPDRSGRRERREHAGRELAAVGAAHLIDRWPATLSGGEAQRVALARALARPASVLLLDEPLSALDPEARQQLGEMVRERVARHGGWALWCSHDREEIGGFSQVVWVREGAARLDR